jgi:hypothetical protein
MRYYEDLKVMHLTLVKGTRRSAFSKQPEGTHNFDSVERVLDSFLSVILYTMTCMSFEHIMDSRNLS